jgi:predicted MFS family arabinose efflux permease
LFFDTLDEENDQKAIHEVISNLNTNISQIEMVDLGYSRSIITLTCYFLLFGSLLNNFDHGALPSALTDIKRDLNFTNVMMGSLGSYVFCGFVVGSIASTFMIDIFSYKILLCLSMICHASGEILFITNYNYYVVGFARFLSGFG